MYYQHLPELQIIRVVQHTQSSLGHEALTARVCDRKGKMKSNAVYKTASEYSENSTVHGVQYIFEKVQRLMLSYLKNLMFVPILETSNM